MVFEARYPTRLGRDKPTMTFEKKQFPFIKDLEVGETGQMRVSIVAESVELRPDEEANEYKYTRYKVIEGKLANDKVSI